MALEVNRGFANAVNAGVHAGRGEFIVLLNNDVELERDAVGEMVAPLRADAAVGSVAPLIVKPAREVIDSFGLVIDPTLAGFSRLHGEPLSSAVATRLRLAGPEGTAGAFRRAAWEAVNGFDPHLIAYHEDVDLALRLAVAGWQTAGAVRAIGVHIGSATYGRRSATVRRLAGHSRGYMLRRWPSAGMRLIVRVVLTETIVVLGDCLLQRDLEAIRGRLQGWSAARGLPRRGRPPLETLEFTLTLRAGLALRCRAVDPRGRATPGEQSRRPPEGREDAQGGDPDDASGDAEELL